MRTLLSLKKWLPPVASATVVAMLIAVMAPTTAGAAITTATPLLGSTLCSGSLSNVPSAERTILPEGDLVALGAWEARIKGDVAPFGSSPGTVSLTIGWYVDATCKDLSLNGQLPTASSNPCVQASYAEGTYTPAAKGTFPTSTQPAIITATFTAVGQTTPNVQPGIPGSDPFLNCTATFEVFPYAGNTASNMTLTGLTGGSNCPMAGSEITLECENH